MGFTSNDAAHLFFGLPVMIYGHLIALDAYNALGRGRKLARWGEGSFLIFFGFIIFALDIIGYKGCSPNGHMCKDINIMHMLIGLFLMGIGTILLMHVYMKVYSHASLWMTPICLAVVGVFMMLHEQGSEYGKVVHTSFGVVALSGALLRGMAIIDPQRWAIFCAYVSTVTCFCFFSGSDSMESFFGERHIMGHTVVLGVVALGTVLLIPFMFFINWMNGGVAPKTIVHSNAESEMPLIGGKF